MQSAQDRFNERYISSKEIIDRVKVSRPTIASARRRGLLPDPVAVSETVTFLWERDEVEPFIKAWEAVLRAQRANR